MASVQTLSNCLDRLNHAVYYVRLPPRRTAWHDPRAQLQDTLDTTRQLLHQAAHRQDKLRKVRDRRLDGPGRAPAHT